MKEITPYDEIRRMHHEQYGKVFKSQGWKDKSVEGFFFAWDLGRTFAEDYPKWIPNNESNQPKNGDRILCYLDDDTIITYTYYDNNKAFVKLFKNHVVAWMLQPKKPIFKDEQDRN